jgi:DNA replication protein DnaC
MQRIRTEEPAAPLTDKVAAPLPRPRPRNSPASSTDHDLISSTPAREGTCPDCRGAGYYTLAVPFDHAQFAKLIPCACLLRARAERAQAAQLEQMRTVLDQLTQSLGRLASARFETFDLHRPLAELTWADQTFPVSVQRQALEQALKDAQAYAEAPRGWLYLCGPCGAGKSHLAAAVANHLARNSWGVTYVSVPDLLRFVRSGIGGGEADARLSALMQIDLLVLDDIGAEYLTPWAQEQLFILLNARYLAERATILTSNDRVEALPARLASRMWDQAQIVWLPMSDYRRLRAP